MNRGRYIVLKDDQVVLCKHCKSLITWIKSQRTGKPYPVDIFHLSTWNDNNYACRSADFHKCKQNEGR